MGCFSGLKITHMPSFRNSNLVSRLYESNLRFPENRVQLYSEELFHEVPRETNDSSSVLALCLCKAGYSHYYSGFRPLSKLPLPVLHRLRCDFCSQIWSYFTSKWIHSRKSRSMLVFPFATISQFRPRLGWKVYKSFRLKEVSFLFCHVAQNPVRA